MYESIMSYPAENGNETRHQKLFCLYLRVKIYPPTDGKSPYHTISYHIIQPPTIGLLLPRAIPKILRLLQRPLKQLPTPNPAPQPGAQQERPTKLSMKTIRLLRRR